MLQTRHPRFLHQNEWQCFRRPAVLPALTEKNYAEIGQVVVSSPARTNALFETTGDLKRCSQLNVRRLATAALQTADQRRPATMDRAETQRRSSAVAAPGNRRSPKTFAYLIVFRYFARTILRSGAPGAADTLMRWLTGTCSGTQPSRLPTFATNCMRSAR